MTTRLYVLHARAPLHVGTGRGVGLIDLPIAREVISSHPIIPGSGVKGVLRSASTRADSASPDDGDTPTTRAFGPAPRNADKYTSALRFSDARLLLMPVQSDHGTFAWVTCPWVLARLTRDATSLAKLPSSPPRLGKHAALVPEGSVLTRSEAIVVGGMKFADTGSLDQKWTEAIADLVFPRDHQWSALLKARLAVVSDDDFTWLVQNRTDVRAHIRIDPETGTVAAGALWYEESLPTESVLVGVVEAIDNTRSAPDDALRHLATLLDSPLQFGGKATTGMGVAAMHLVGGPR